MLIYIKNVRERIYLLRSPVDCLFTYGTLCPDRENHHIVAPILGTWQKGYVNGVVHTLDWGPDLGLPAIVLNPEDPKVKGYFLISDQLQDHWQRLDEFEGFQYERVQVVGYLESGEIQHAWVYVMKS